MIHSRWRSPRTPLRALIFVLISSGIPTAAFARAEKSPAAAPSKVAVTTIVTVLGPNFTEPPALAKEDVIVTTGKQTHETVTGWTGAQASTGALDLAILIDDLDSQEIANQLADVRKFIQDQSKDTRVGVFYADNGTARPGIDFTSDHDAAAKALRTPLGFGAASVSVYQSLLDLFRKWRPSKARREVFVLADGIDRFRGDPQSPDVDLVIQKAQEGGVVVHSLYVREAGRFGRNQFRVNLGMSNLGELADATGGEFFSQGLDTPVSFAPFLGQLDSILHNQYWLTFTTARSEKKKGELRPFRVTVEEKRAEISHARNVFVPGP